MTAKIKEDFGKMNRPTGSFIAFFTFDSTDQCATPMPRRFNSLVPLFQNTFDALFTDKCYKIIRSVRALIFQNTTLDVDHV